MSILEIIMLALRPSFWFVISHDLSQLNETEINLNTYLE